MIVLTAFVSICVVAVLFLLRFLVAIESEIGSARKRSLASVKRLSTYRIPVLAGAKGAVPVLTYHSDAGLALRGASFAHSSTKDSQLKRA